MAAALGNKAKEMSKKMRGVKDGGVDGDDSSTPPSGKKRKCKPDRGTCMCDMYVYVHTLSLTHTDNFAGNSRAKTLAPGLSGITNVLESSLKVEKQHRDRINTLMLAQLKFRKQQSIESNSHDKLMGLLAAGVPFQEAQKHVSEQKKLSHQRLKEELVDLNSLIDLT